MDFTKEELHLIWISLLCAGNGRIPNTVDRNERVELTDEAQQEARILALKIGFKLND